MTAYAQDSNDSIMNGYSSSTRYWTEPEADDSMGRRETTTQWSWSSMSSQCEEWYLIRSWVWVKKMSLRLMHTWGWIERGRLKLNEKRSRRISEERHGKDRSILDSKPKLRLRFGSDHTCMMNVQRTLIEFVVNNVGSKVLKEQTDRSARRPWRRSITKVDDEIWRRWWSVLLLVVVTSKDEESIINASVARFSYCFPRWRIWDDDTKEKEMTHEEDHCCFADVNVHRLGQERASCMIIERIWDVIYIGPSLFPSLSFFLSFFLFLLFLFDVLGQYVHWLDG